MRKLVGVLVVVGVLAAGGVTYALLSSPSTATAQVAGSGDSTTTTTTLAAGDTESTDDAARTRRWDIVGDVLDGLVADGVITQAQADQISDAVAARREELRAESGDGRGLGGRHGGFGRGLSDLLEDGVIDADELAGLPEGHPLTDPDGPAAPYLEDGQITQEELDELLAELGPDGLGFFRHHGLDSDSDTGTGSDEDATESSFSF